jgi:hypothetical protein
LIKIENRNRAKRGEQRSEKGFRIKPGNAPISVQKLLPESAEKKKMF